MAMIPAPAVDCGFNVENMEPGALGAEPVRHHANRRESTLKIGSRTAVRRDSSHRKASFLEPNWDFLDQIG